MADLVELTLATACATGTWTRHGQHGRWIAWAKDPDATERKASFFSHGGAQTNWEDLELSGAAYLMMVNELNVVLISYDTSPGYFRLPGGEGTSCRDVFDTQYEHMEFISHMRSIAGHADNDVLPAGMWITTDPDFSMHGGSSSGGYNVLRAQFAPDGTLPYSRDRAITGVRGFAREHSHLCNILFINSAQVTLSQFHEYVTDIPDEDDTTYVTSGSTAAGSTTINIVGDTRELRRGNRIKITVSGPAVEYAIMEDSGDSPSSITVKPAVPVTIPDGTPIVFQHHAVKAFGTRSWAQQYLFSYHSGYVWRSDDASGDGFPLEVKRHADVDYMLDLTNPRVHEVSIIATGATGTSLVRSTTTGELSFRNWFTAGQINPLYADLHDEGPVMWLLDWLYFTAGNTNMEFWSGNNVTNVNPGDPSVPWNKGRHIDFSAAHLKTFLQARGW